MSLFNQAKAYHTYSMGQREEGQELIRYLAPKRGSKVLDLGCGTGMFSKLLADLVGPEGQVVAIDPDAERLKVARKQYPAINLEYVEGSSENIPGSSYDFVFSNHVLQQVKNKESLFKYVARILKKGGKFGFRCSYASEMFDSLLSEDILNKNFLQDVKSGMNFTSLDEYKHLAESNGFIIDKFELGDLILTYSDIEELKSGYLIFYTTFITGLDRSDIDSEAMARKFGEGNINMTFKTLCSILTKQ